ncbi:hypothetical protein VB816_21910 [Limnoraphis robusta CCNP1324]|uniref:hypothetical protein n=1 Tax=Limnoraphis robusta TaxID=1118279 RepID=UPI002B201FCE|nr:hypothetical protein [Limnoraphis robusta]MEA5547640.1 hypothetical protein [Limnoraphis robusta CCNP1324]
MPGRDREITLRFLAEPTDVNFGGNFTLAEARAGRGLPQAARRRHRPDRGPGGQQGVA